MLRHPIHINRPFVVTERGYLAKEDGEVVIDEQGARLVR
jgi:hypothetical protein